MISVQKQWKLWWVLLGILAPIWKDSDAWVSHRVQHNDARAFLPLSQKPTFSKTALSVLDRRDFFGQIAAGVAATANVNSKPNAGVYDTRSPAPVPIKTPSNPRNRTGYSGNGRRGKKKPPPSLVEEEEGGSPTKSYMRGKTLGGRSTSPSDSFKGSSKGTSSRGGSSSSSSSSSACFPGDVWVQVVQIHDDGHQSWRSTKMEDLVLGDRVLTGSDSISTVYAFGTRDSNIRTLFEKFVGESGEVLEVTENHILFFGNGTSEVAWNVDPEDTLLRVWRNNSTTRIVQKESIEKEGAYHPYTLDGKLVVNGFQVSVHSIDTTVPYLGIDEHTLYDIHEFQQLLFSPLRLLYWWSPEIYSTISNHDTEDGSHHYVDLIESLQIFLLPSNNEEAAVNFADWNLPMFPLRILLLMILIGCHMTEQILLLASWGNWGAMFFCLVVGLIATNQYWDKKRRK